MPSDEDIESIRLELSALRVLVLSMLGETALSGRTAVQAQKFIDNVSRIADETADSMALDAEITSEDMRLKLRTRLRRLSKAISFSVKTDF